MTDRADRPTGHRATKGRYEPRRLWRELGTDETRSPHGRLRDHPSTRTDQR